MTMVLLVREDIENSKSDNDGDDDKDDERSAYIVMYKLRVYRVPELDAAFGYRGNNKRTASKHVHARQQHQMKSYRSAIALDICAILIEALKYSKNYTHIRLRTRTRTRTSSHSISIKTIGEATSKWGENILIV